MSLTSQIFSEYYLHDEYTKNRQEEGLALQALRDSEKLLHQIEIARNHIEQVFRVQILHNAPM